MVIREVCGTNLQVMHPVRTFLLPLRPEPFGEGKGEVARYGREIIETGVITGR